MKRVTKSLTNRLTDQRTRLAGYANTAGFPYTGWVRLMVNPQLPDSPTIDDVTGANFRGYQPQSVATLGGWKGPINVGPDRLAMTLKALWVAQGGGGPGLTSVPPGQVVTGYYFTDSVGVLLRAWEMFDSPVPMGKDDDSLQLTVMITWPLSWDVAGG